MKQPRQQINRKEVRAQPLSHANRRSLHPITFFAECPGAAKLEFYFYSPNSKWGPPRPPVNPVLPSDAQAPGPPNSLFLRSLSSFSQYLELISSNHLPGFSASLILPCPHNCPRLVPPYKSFASGTFPLLNITHTHKHPQHIPSHLQTLLSFPIRR